MATEEHDYLRRLPREYYQGLSYVHWSLTMEDRKTGWLIPIVYYKFRELLAHTVFRYGLCCPIYCLMPDHLHLLWMGLFPGSDQLNGMKFFRMQFNLVLATQQTKLQFQPYEHVLKEEERLQSAFETIVEYIARNPERSGLVATDQFAKYAYTGCLIPGYPDVKVFQPDYWSLFWRLHQKLQKEGLVRLMDKAPKV